MNNNISYRQINVYCNKNCACLKLWKCYFILSEIYSTFFLRFSKHELIPYHNTPPKKNKKNQRILLVASHPILCCCAGRL